MSAMYPDAHLRTYCVPPVHFNKLPYDRRAVPGTHLSALVLNDPPGSSTLPVTRVMPSTPQAGQVITNASQAGQPSGGGAAPQGKAEPSCRPSISSSQGAAAASQHQHQQQSPPPQQQQQQQQHVYSMWTPDSQTQPQTEPESFQLSDAQADFAQSFVLANLQELGRRQQEVMFIVSQLDFGCYMNRPCYAAAAARLPKPADLDEKYRRGDFDVLVIHRLYGILAGEVKSVGLAHAGVEKTEEEADADVAVKVRKAIKQLDKSETVVRHLVSDVARGLAVRKTLFLPFVSGAQLQRVLGSNPQLEEVCAY